jgi:hypothetical protein
MHELPSFDRIRIQYGFWGTKNEVEKKELLQQQRQKVPSVTV